MLVVYVIAVLIGALAMWWSFSDGWDDLGEGLFLTVLSAGAVWGIGEIIVTCNRDSDHQKVLMEQCIEDGHKEYECVSMLRSPESTVIPVPVIIAGR